MAPAITFGGLASGLDTDAIIAALAAVQQRPIGLLEQRRAETDSLRKRYQSLDDKIETLRNRTRELEKATGLLSFDAASSNTSVATVSASSAASEGSFSLKVVNLASVEVDASAGYADYTTTSAGTGTIGITVGTNTKSITIAAGDDTLEKIRDKINDADAGVTATIVNEGTGANPYKLVLQGKTSGADGAFSVDLTQFTGSLSMTETQAAANSKIEVNGLVVERSTNKIDDVVPGMSFNLVGTNATPITVTVTKDLDGIKDKIKSYVAAHNDAINFINNEIKATNNKGGAFNGESTVRDVKDRLLRALGAGGYPGGEFENLAEIGVDLQKDGTLAFNEADFDEAAAENLADVTSLLTKAGKKFADKGFGLVQNPTKLASGVYQVAITQIATKGTVTAGATFAGGATLGADETLTIAQGDKSTTVKILAGKTLAEAVTQINKALSKANIDIEVSDSSGSLKFDAEGYGSENNFTVVSDIASGAGSTGVGTTEIAGTGLDAQGTIGGVALKGDGQELTGDKDTIYKGLKFTFNGDAPKNTELTIGPDGFFVAATDSLDQILAAVNGPLAARLDGLQDQIQDYNKNIDSLEERAKSYEERLRAQFTAMESIISRLNTQKGYLSSVGIG